MIRHFSVLGLAMFLYTDSGLEIEGSQNEPLHVQVLNKGSGNNVYSEFRAVTKVGAADFGITGPEFRDGSNMLGNEAFVVAESTARGLHLRHNGQGWVRVSVGEAPREVILWDANGWHYLVPAARSPKTREMPDSGFLLWVSPEDGGLYAKSHRGTVTRLAGR